jgi:hypothetical protein
MRVTVSTLIIIYISIQGLGGLDHELGYNEHVLGISSAGPYPGTIMNHANAFPPARYSSTMPVGYNDPPHLTTVGVFTFTYLHSPFVDVGFVEGPWRTSGDRKSTPT